MRARIALLLVVPLVSLVGLWGFAAQVTLADALNKFVVETTYEEIGVPGQSLVGTLQYERTVSAVHVAMGRPANGSAAMMDLRKKVDEFDAEFRKHALTPDVRDKANDAINEQVDAFVKQLDRLKEIRAAVSGTYDAIQTIDNYSQVVNSGMSLFGALIIVDDLEIYQQGHALVTFSRARDLAMREDALIKGILGSGGRMTQKQHQLFASWTFSQRNLTDNAYIELGPELRVTADSIAGSQTFADFSAMEDLINRLPGGSLPVSVSANWSESTDNILQVWAGSLEAAGKGLKEQSKPIGERIVFRLLLAGGLGLLAVIVSIVMSVLLARGLSRELRGLQVAARELAEQRLPWVVARLRRGETVDVEQEVPPLSFPARTTEVARVAEAFGKVQKTAIETSVGEAHLRKGISRVFLNLAWRSQSLLHRQLRMLDALERRAPDPDTLNDLFQLDHLTTRMRRHAEGLIILSGSAPGRTWSKPVHMVDVLRGAVAEVEDYTRVEVVSNAPVAMAGSAVADIIHLLAELIENGTAFSPPPTEVMVHGEVVGNGFAVEIIDRGVGLPANELAELNQRLTHAPEFDLADTDRLGLFVVSRLAARHGIRVTLQPSAFGGVSAVVLIPHALIVPEAAIEEERAPVAVVARAAEPPRQALAVEAPSDGSLPKRVRQNSLVPQLRQQAEAPAPRVEPDERAPEESRDLFSSLQAGWQRARDED